jgi:ubiquinone/menaquinone biosynthesis C-methylase UbiE
MFWSSRNYKWFYDHFHSHYYDLLTKWCFLPLGGEEKVRKELIAHVDLSPGDKILDMCCGTGAVTFIVAQRAGQSSEVIGMDLSSGQLAVARKKNHLSNVRFIEGDASATGFEGGSFDKVFISHALHEMRRETRLKVLVEARRVLRENGELVILEVDDPESLLVRLFMGFWLFYWLPFNFETPTRRDMLRQGLIKEIEKADFRHAIKLSKYHGVFQVVHGVK